MILFKTPIIDFRNKGLILKNLFENPEVSSFSNGDIGPNLTIRLRSSNITGFEYGCLPASGYMTFTCAGVGRC